MRSLALALLSAFLLSLAVAQQAKPPKQRVEKTTPQQQPAPSATPEAKPEQAKPVEEPKPPAPTPGKEKEDEREEQDLRFDMAEVPPVTTHHQMTVSGRALKYTATAGRLPIKRADGKIEAEMFFVAYTLDNENSAQRPLTFAFNGGPGSASVWLHMGALGPRRVVLQPQGFMPPPPYRIQDNPHTLLDKSDLVLVDAIGTGFSRAADAKLQKHFLGVEGDIQAYGEFVRMYISRYERWASPLFMLGESYGTTRAAGVAGYLADKGISFNGIAFLSTAIDLGTLIFSRGNDVPYILILPSYTMIAAYHHKLAADLTQDLTKTRKEVEQWASNQYAQALAKGDALSAQDRRAVVDQLSRYTGLAKDVVDQADLRIDVRKFTHYLLLDQKLRVGRLDGRFVGPDPQGLLDTPFYDPTSAAILPPFTSIFNNYVRAELGYKSDMPYYVFAFGGQSSFEKWDWGSAVKGFPDTAAALREAMTKNAYTKILFMEGFYDLATPYYAADYTVDHLNLPANLRKNIAFATYDSGHMVYLGMDQLAKMKRDVAGFIDSATSH
jgi:carboxypeptidase C (cathepsin A)